MQMRVTTNASWIAAAGLCFWVMSLAASGAITLPSPPEGGVGRPPILPVPAPVDAQANPPAAAPPRLAPANDTGGPLRLTLDLSDGSRLIGTPAISNLEMRAGFGRVTVDLTQLQSIQFQPDKETATAIFQNGDKVSGAFSLPALDLKTCFGPARIPLTVVRRISVTPGGKNSRGLVVHYTFDQEDTAAVRDQSGQGHDGKLIGARWTPQGKSGGGCVISGGVEEVAVVGTDKLLLEEFTLAAWLKRSDPNRTSSGGYHAAFVGLSGRKATFFGLQPDGRLYLWGADGFRTVPARVADLEWHHVAVAKRAKTIVFYLDGENVGEAEYGFPADMREGLSFGSVGNQVGYPFVGTLDELMVFDRSLSDEEVKQLFKSNQ
jgi:hypothetical protein